MVYLLLHSAREAHLLFLLAQTLLQVIRQGAENHGRLVRVVPVGGAAKRFLVVEIVAHLLQFLLGIPERIGLQDTIDLQRVHHPVAMHRTVIAKLIINTSLHRLLTMLVQPFVIDRQAAFRLEFRQIQTVLERQILHRIQLAHHGPIIQFQS